MGRFAEKEIYALEAPDGFSGALSPGPGSFYFVETRNGVVESLPVRYYQPVDFTESGPIVFVMHGTRRNAAEYRDSWMQTAERLGFLLVCPEFPAGCYPRKAYQLGGLINGSGEQTPEEDWTFGKVERLFDFVKEKTGTVKDSYQIYGHSAGGQFVHRLALFMPQARFETAVAANTGWYTMPTFDGKKFPYGLRRSGATRSGLEKAFGRRLVVMLGERDTDAGDSTLRKSKAARRQGETRLERGLAFYSTAQDEASELGVPLNWKLATVPGVAHYDPHMMPAAARVLFGCEYAGTRTLLETTALSGNCCKVFVSSLKKC